MSARRLAFAIGFVCAGPACLGGSGGTSASLAAGPPVPGAATPGVEGATTVVPASSEPPVLPPSLQQGPIKLPAPPFAYTLVAPAPVQSGGQGLALVRVQSNGNGITDLEAWFKKNRLALPSVRDHLPADVPERVGRAVLVEAIAQPDGHLLLLYQVGGLTRIVAVIDPKSRLTALFDFELYGLAPATLPDSELYMAQSISWAAVDGGVLYVSHHHGSYAKSSGGLNGFISAIDVAQAKLLWRSASLVSNAVNFVLADGHLIAGYGFTDEPDFIYVLDQATGRTVSKLPVHSRAEYFVLRERKLHVRTYDTDYVYELRLEAR